MGTGVGEAMLIGAVTGAGTSAITGGDPLKGALFGLAGGAIGPALTGALGSGAAAATPTLTSAASAVPGSFQAALPELGIQTAASQAGASVVPGSFQAALPNLTSNIASAAPASFTPSTGDLLSRDSNTTSQIGNRIAELMGKYPNGFPAATGALTSMTFNRPEIEMPDTEYKGPLSRFRFDPARYRPLGMADGGIADLPATQRYAGGGNLGGYSDGGRMLKGPGDGMSDSIPARIGSRQPARLADGEFVVPADVVSHLGNGSTDAGAKQLYGMMDKVRKARTGTKKQGREINPRKLMPA